MTQPVTSGRREWVDLVGPPPPPALPIEKGPLETDALPDPAIASPGQGVVRLIPRPALGLDPAKGTAGIVGARLDAFLARATPTFRTDEGWVAVPIAFHMSSTDPVHFPDLPLPTDATLTRLALQAGVSANDASLLRQGRASPEVIAKGTQALIDAGFLPARSSSGSRGIGDRIRQLMFSWGIGLDCAGYVAPASLAASGRTRTEAGFRVPQDEPLRTLWAGGFVEVKDVTTVQPGDVFVLLPASRGDPGHRAIVRDARPASLAEVERIKASWKSPEAEKASDTWLKVVVDSSWGAGNDPLYGGVQRNTWWRDGTTGFWVSTGITGVTGSPGPCAHKEFQVFRPAWSR